MFAVYVYVHYNIQFKYKPAHFFDSVHVQCLSLFASQRLSLGKKQAVERSVALIIFFC